MDTLPLEETVGNGGLSCPLCGSSNHQALGLDSASAIVDEFIWRYLDIDWSIPVRTVCCETCQLIYFDRAYTQEEVSRLYSGYRGLEYTSQRLLYDPSYKSYSDAYRNRLSNYYLLRVRALANVLQDEVMTSWLAMFKSSRKNQRRDYSECWNHLIRACDYGSSDPYIVETCLASLGIEGFKIDTYDVGLPSVVPEHYDLVVYDQVAEHLGCLDSIEAFISSCRSGSRHLIGVPLELPRNMIPRNAMAMLNKKRVANPTFQVNFSVVHEHINFFSEISLIEWAKRLELHCNGKMVLFVNGTATSSCIIKAEPEMGIAYICLERS